MKEFKQGQILENSVSQFAKVISVNNGVYGVSDWTTRKEAEKATVANRHVNGYGLEYAGAKVVGAKGSAAKPKEEAKPKTATAPKKAAAKPKAK